MIRVWVFNKLFCRLFTRLLRNNKEVKMLARSIQLLAEMQYPSGLFSASRKDVKTGYNLSWMRDNVYATLGFEAVKNVTAVKKTYHALLGILLKHEDKIDSIIEKPEPKDAYRYIHARFQPDTFEEIHEEWGNKQNDAVGAVLFKIGDLEKKGIKIIRSDNDIRILQKLVNYLEALKYWQDPDNGMWEENEEVHSSSVGACVAGLREIKKIKGLKVSAELISKGEKTLNRLLPRESKTKETDLALLSLIYPYNVVNDTQREMILEAVERKLVREKGVIRYEKDKYYSNGSEAEWCFGFPWLAIIYRNSKRTDKYAYYLRKTMEVANADSELPELYYGKSNKHNENTPLGWGQSLSIVALT
jgi:GH15 family glucan-1,4-alpha-glucosidase